MTNIININDFRKCVAVTVEAEPEQEYDEPQSIAEFYDRFELETQLAFLPFVTMLKAMSDQSSYEPLYTYCRRHNKNPDIMVDYAHILNELLRIEKQKELNE